MNDSIKKYFKKDLAGYYLDSKSNKYLLRGVSCSFDKTRNLKASEQSKKYPTSYSKIYFLINSFLELIREDNGFTERNIKLDTIELNGEKKAL